MPLHPEFPESPHDVIDPSVRWTPDSAQIPLSGMGMLLPPLVQKIREDVNEISNDVVYDYVFVDEEGFISTNRQHFSSCLTVLPNTKQRNDALKHNDNAAM